MREQKLTKSTYSAAEARAVGVIGEIGVIQSKRKIGEGDGPGIWTENRDGNRNRSDFI